MMSAIFPGPLSAARRASPREVSLWIFHTAERPPAPAPVARGEVEDAPQSAVKSQRLAAASATKALTLAGRKRPPG